MKPGDLMEINAYPVIQVLREVRDDPAVPMHIQADADQVLVEIFDIDDNPYSPTPPGAGSGATRGATE